MAGMSVFRLSCSKLACLCSGVSKATDSNYVAQGGPVHLQVNQKPTAGVDEHAFEEGGHRCHLDSQMQFLRTL